MDPFSFGILTLSFASSTNVSLVVHYLLTNFQPGIKELSGLINDRAFLVTTDQFQTGKLAYISFSAGFNFSTYAYSVLASLNIYIWQYNLDFQHFHDRPKILKIFYLWGKIIVNVKTLQNKTTLFTSSASWATKYLKLSGKLVQILTIDITSMVAQIGQPVSNTFAMYYRNIIDNGGMEASCWIKILFILRDVIFSVFLIVNCNLIVKCLCNVI